MKFKCGCLSAARAKRLSCGSAAVAAAVAAIRGGGQGPQRAMLPGGALLCGWEGGDNPAWLQGEINFVYEGVLRLPPPMR